jgi:hypothetical protein
MVKARSPIVVPGVCVLMWFAVVNHKNKVNEVEESHGQTFYHIEGYASR